MATKTLSGPPGVLLNYGRAFGSALPLAGRLPFLPGGGGAIPDLALEVPPRAPDPQHVAQYARVCGYALRDTLPAVYLNVLAFPVHIALVSDSAFPISPVGLVHVENAITQRRPIHVREELGIRVWATGTDPHPAGRTFTLHTEIHAREELVWTGASTMLQRGAPTAERTERGPEPDPPEPSSTWRLPADLGRRYAAVSGDRNPIHMSDLTAKPLGFPRAIAHGLWTKGRAVAQLDGRLPGAFSVEVAFRKPILLPATVTFAARFDDGGEIAFTVRDRRRGTPHLDGSVRPSNEESI